MRYICGWGMKTLQIWLQLCIYLKMYVQDVIYEEGYNYVNFNKMARLLKLTLNYNPINI